MQLVPLSFNGRVSILIDRRDQWVEERMRHLDEVPAEEGEDLFTEQRL